VCIDKIALKTIEQDYSGSITTSKVEIFFWTLLPVIGSFFDETPFFKAEFTVFIKKGIFFSKQTNFPYH